MRTSIRFALCAALGLFLLPPDSADAGRRRGTPNTHEPVGSQTFASPQSNPIVHSPTQDRAYVANSTSNSVSVIDTDPASGTFNTVIAEIEVGIDPGGLAVRPDGNEVWVSNHISDSVSVIDTDPVSVSLHEVVETIQDLDGSGVSQFDEPVGIAFASNSKAYVALSSRNDIAVVDATNYTVTSRIHITAQDPRAIHVAGGLLFVAAFESGNQSELSLCPTVATPPGNPPQCTLDGDDLADFVLESPNIPGSDTRIVRDPDVPDRDLFVIDTTTDSVIGVIEGLGTLLYGVTADSSGNVFISLTEARNDVNGEDGQNLDVLENRLFLNQIAEVDCSGGNCSCGGGLNPVCTPGAAPRTIHDLEPLPPSNPASGDQVATPFGIALTSDDNTLVVTAAASSRLFTVQASSGNVLSRLDVGVIPRGVALRDNGDGTHTAYVLNTLGNTVSVVTVTNATGALASAGADIPVGNDPTDNDVRLGRIAFNDAEASTTGTFSCASCHPDGMNDQLLWRIGGACFFGACTEDDEIRSTMPVRGLKNTLPLHWDGTLGDPFGGTDGSLGGGGNNPADCDLGGPEAEHDCFRHLVDGSQTGVMCTPPCNGGGELTSTERDNMATFLGGVNTSGQFVGGGIPYPPARERPLDDVISASASAGFSDFFVDQPGTFPNDLGDLAGVTTCADMDSGCHALPLGVDHNSTTLAGFDVPTMRGMTDRFLQFSIGITAPEEALQAADDGDVCVDLGFGPICTASDVPWDPEEGFEENGVFSAAFPIFQPVYGSGSLDMFQMFEEASTGFSGAVGRQVTLNNVTTAGCNPAHACGAGGICSTMALLCQLEDADARGVVNLRGAGSRNGAPLEFSYNDDSGNYEIGFSLKRTREQLISEAQSIVIPYVRATLTGHLRENVGLDPQPLISITNLGDGNGTNPDIPLLPGDNPMVLSPTDVLAGAEVFVDGELATLAAGISCSGSFPCTSPETLTINLDLGAMGLSNDLHLLQVQNPSGSISPELPICVGSIAACD
jgi:YVTN family beta-propeller protein